MQALLREEPCCGVPGVPQRHRPGGAARDLQRLQLARVHGVLPVLLLQQVPHRAEVRARGGDGLLLGGVQEDDVLGEHRAVWAAAAECPRFYCKMPLEEDEKKEYYRGKQKIVFSSSDFSVLTSKMFIKHLILKMVMTPSFPLLPKCEVFELEA